MDMHRTRPADARDASYIWLRYSTQFTTGGRSHTIAMDIPVPVGASAEERELLIREAEAGIEQMYRQIEKRNQRPLPSDASKPQAAVQRSGGYQPQQPAPPDVRPTAPAAPVRPAAQVQPPQSQQPAIRTPAHEAPQPISLQEKREATDAPAPARGSIGSEMPLTHNLNGPASGNMKLGEFIQIIRNTWGLAPKDAMELLQVKTLNNMNLRDLLRQLEPLAQQRVESTPKNTASPPRPVVAPAPASSAQRPSAPVSSTTMRSEPPRPRPVTQAQPQQAAAPTTSQSRSPAPLSSNAPAKLPGTATAPPLAGPSNIPVFPLKENTLREAPRSYKFDEEEEEMEEPGGDTDTGEDEEQTGMSDALARIKIDELRDIRGTAPVSPQRLTVLHNLLDSQISERQLQQLIQGLWSIDADKKLKQDHVEALISWGKEDYFDDEVRAVLAVLNG